MYFPIWLLGVEQVGYICLLLWSYRFKIGPQFSHLLLKVFIKQLKMLLLVWQLLTQFFNLIVDRIFVSISNCLLHLVFSAFHLVDPINQNYQVLHLQLLLFQSAIYLETTSHLFMLHLGKFRCKVFNYLGLLTVFLFLYWVYNLVQSFHNLNQSLFSSVQSFLV